MPSDGDSFLPRILSVFYSVFDIRQGPKIVYQVPEGLIAVPPPSYPSVPATPTTDTPPTPSSNSSNHPMGLVSRNSSSSLSGLQGHLSQSSPRKRSISSNRTLFNFDDISKYVIPPSPLCGRLVTCSTKRHRIIGFPVELYGKYQRNYFRFNLCFVFARGADLSCYEPIVRKVTRVLTACEEESGFLSNLNNLSTPGASSSSSGGPPGKDAGAGKVHAIYAILEQLYEDLNSYSETSIPIDQFNSIELKIFPFYPNPMEVREWMVPVALINLDKRIEENWDLTMVKVCRFIDGTNHVGRIAHLADCDLKLTRLAISHLLYYQVIMTIDIFQFSNMYTLRKSIQWLADEPHVKEECGPYVTTPGASIPDWPKLLRLYSRLKPGKTVLEWMEEHNVHELGIDVRRFTSFGVIKGFLRRVHRWPYLHPSSLAHSDAITSAQGAPLTLGLERAKSFSGILRFPQYGPPSPIAMNEANQNPSLRGRSPTVPQSQTNAGNTAGPTISPDLAMGSPSTLRATAAGPMSTTNQNYLPYRARRTSAAEKVLEQVRIRDRDSLQQKSVAVSPRTSWIHQPSESGYHPGSGSGSASTSASAYAPGITATSSTPTTDGQESPSPDNAGMLSLMNGGGSRLGNNTSEGRRASLISLRDSHRDMYSHHLVPPNSPKPPLKPRLSRSPSAPLVPTAQSVASTTTIHTGVGVGAGQNGNTNSNSNLLSAQGTLIPPFPPELLGLLDGEHHTDELAVKFEVGWPVLEQWLVAIGGGAGDGDFGGVSIIYR